MFNNPLRLCFLLTLRPFYDLRRTSTITVKRNHQEIMLSPCRSIFVLVCPELTILSLFRISQLADQAAQPQRWPFLDTHSPTYIWSLPRFFLHQNLK